MVTLHATNTTACLLMQAALAANASPQHIAAPTNMDRSKGGIDRETYGVVPKCLDDHCAVIQSRGISQDACRNEQFAHQRSARPNNCLATWWTTGQARPCCASPLPTSRQPSRRPVSSARCAPRSILRWVCGRTTKVHLRYTFCMSRDSAPMWEAKNHNRRRKRSSTRLVKSGCALFSWAC